MEGDPGLGHTLALSPGATSPGNVTVGYRWLRNGVRIRGEIGSRHRITPSDLGSRITGRVVYSKPGYRTIIRDLPASRRATSAARVSISSPAHRMVRVKITARGVPVVRGYVTITARDGTERTRLLKHGESTFRPTWLYAGQRPIKVSYSGSAKVDRASSRRLVTVR